MLYIIVPYRNREEHLKIFCEEIRDYLNLQNIENTIVIVEQEEGKPFNRGCLLNIGFDLSKDISDYFCFHDVDMIPIIADYTTISGPTHISCIVEQFNWVLPYETYFGGVTLFDKESFLKINGYSNEYWGWGAEDDDLFIRCEINNINVFRRNCSFRSLPHERKPDPNLYRINCENLMEFSKNRESINKKSGLNNLRYEIIEENPNYLDGVKYYKVSI